MVSPPAVANLMIGGEQAIARRRKLDDRAFRLHGAGKEPEPSARQWSTSSKATRTAAYR
jgi:hypothetical protein